MFYQCMQDSTQLLKIVSVEAGQALVKVFYKEKDLNKEPRFVGKSLRPASLFSDDPGNNRYGYRPWRKEQELEKIRQEEARRAAYLERRQRRDDDYED